MHLWRAMQFASLITSALEQEEQHLPSILPYPQGFICRPVEEGVGGGERTVGGLDHGGQSKSLHFFQPGSQLQCAEASRTVVQTHNQSSFTAIYSDVLGGMFNLCSISSVQSKFV